MSCLLILPIDSVKGKKDEVGIFDLIPESGEYHLEKRLQFAK